MQQSARSHAASFLVIFTAVFASACQDSLRPVDPDTDASLNVGALEKALSGASSISGGENHTCAIRPNATVACWGKNGDGQLGDGTFSNKSTAVSVVGLTNVVSVAAGRFHSCAILADGTGR